mgnify:CR=1 FL=1
MKDSKSANSKKDAMALVTRKRFMDDLVPKDCLIVKLLRSPHANAIIKEINKTAAEKVPGIEAIYTWEDVPQQRFTTAGQTYPEATPYDRLILDRHVRFVGDPVAIIAGEDEPAWKSHASDQSEIMKCFRQFWIFMWQKIMKS